MPLIYCDHNYVVTALQAPDKYRAHVRQLAATGTVTFVLSPMHWVEAAEDANLARGDAKADFMDSLHARWLSIDEAFNAEKWPRCFSII